MSSASLGGTLSRCDRSHGEGRVEEVENEDQELKQEGGKKNTYFNLRERFFLVWFKHQVPYSGSILSGITWSLPADDRSVKAELEP